LDGSESAAISAIRGKSVVELDSWIKANSVFSSGNLVNDRAYSLTRFSRRILVRHPLW